MKPKIERPRIGSRVYDTPYLSNEMIKKISMGCKKAKSGENENHLT